MSITSNTLLFGDNINFLSDAEALPNESVDLVYLDPPFNSDAHYNMIFKETSEEESEAQEKAFSDTWSWDQASTDALARLMSDQHASIESQSLMETLGRVLGRSSMFAYLVQMTIRLVHLRRVLKKTGSLYLHCDPSASHYLKLVLDCVFGIDNFQSEIIWRRTGSHNKSQRWAPIHDTILYYSGSKSFTWNNPVRPYMKGHVKDYFVQDNKGWRTNYYGNVLTGSGIRGGESGKPWRGFNPTAKRRHWAIPGKLVEGLDEDISSLTQHQKLDRLLELGHIVIRKGETWPIYQRYIQATEGPAAPDIWAFQPYTEGTVFGSDDCIDQDVRWLSPRDQERLGYPTQKPLGLLKRIVLASSRPGDVVLDPFCGCGTTIDAVETLNREYPTLPPRRWIGIDITHLAINLIKYRLADRFKDIPAKYAVRGEPQDVAGARALFQQDPFQFQFWACGLVGARTLGGGSIKTAKKGADRGIDGQRFFVDDTSGMKRILVQVKGGKAGSRDIRDFRGTIEREKAAIGVFIAFEEPTKPMREEAASLAPYKSQSTRSGVPRLQIVTIEQLLSGGSPSQPSGIVLPRGMDSSSDKTFAKAKQHRSDSLFSKHDD